MTEPAFQRVEELFHRAVEVDAKRRAAFLDAACGDDAALRAAVQELLDHDAADDDDFLASPVSRPTDGSDGTTLPAPAGAFVPPPTVPGYEILAEIGRGGMGVVFEARQLNLNRVVALKMLLPAAPGDPKPLARFRTEAEVLARLRHPNIVPIYDFGEAGNRPYFTMEYVPGPNLARFLDRRPQDPAASARLVETLARTMHAAHECGVVHRDLKPANVLLAAPAEGRPPLVACEPRVTDFGLARDMTAPRDLTQTGVALGTPCYMAPEQARGDRANVGPATDIYSLGTILYEMLAGRPPFDAESPVETMRQVVYDDPVSPARLQPRLTHDLVTICMKCLEKSPRRRYASALELAEDLRRFGAGEPIRARPVGPVERARRWCLRRPLAASLIALLAVLAAAFVVSVLVYDHLLRQALDREAALNEELRRRVVRLDVTVGTDREKAGDAFTALLYYTDALRLDESLPEGTRDDRARIADDLRRCPRLVLLLTLGGAVDRASIRADGRSVVVAGRDGAVRAYDLDTGETRVLEGAEAVLAAPPAAGPPAAVSPDGRLTIGGDGEGGVRVREAKGEPVAPPMRQGGPVKAAAFGPDGKRVVVVGEAGVICVWDLTGGGEDVDARTPDELEALAEVLSGARLGDDRAPEPLDAAALRAAWDRAPHQR